MSHAKRAIKVTSHLGDITMGVYSDFRMSALCKSHQQQCWVQQWEQGQGEGADGRQPATAVRRRIPAVSMSLKVRPSGVVRSVSMASLVVPLMLLTIERSSPGAPSSDI